MEIVLYGDSQIGHLREFDSEEWAGLYGHAYSAAAYGIPGVSSSELLWRIRDGEFQDGMAPRAVVVLIGINDVLRAHHPGINDPVEDSDDTEVPTIEVPQTAVPSSAKPSGCISPQQAIIALPFQHLHLSIRHC